MGAISLAGGGAKGLPEEVFLQPQRWRSGGAAGERPWADLLGLTRSTTVLLLEDTDGTLASHFAAVVTIADG